MGFQVPASGVVANPHGYYLLPTLTRAGGHNHPHRIQFDCRLRRVPLGHGGDRSQYGTYLAALRIALRVCCGYTAPPDKGGLQRGDLPAAPGRRRGGGRLSC